MEARFRALQSDGCPDARTLRMLDDWMRCAFGRRGLGGRRRVRHGILPSVAFTYFEFALGPGTTSPEPGAWEQGLFKV